jgi:hypothetical protein
MKGQDSPNGAEKTVHWRARRDLLDEWSPQGQRCDNPKTSKPVIAEIGRSAQREPKPVTRHCHKLVTCSPPNSQCHTHSCSDL